MSERIGDEITKQKGRADEVVARLLDAAGVDESLNLAPGTARSWMDGEAFVRRFAEERLKWWSTASSMRTSQGS